MTATMPSSVRTSITIVIAPAANISFSTSTSVVMRVTSRPTGLRSKYAIGSRCTCAKTSMRRSRERALRDDHRQVVLPVEEPELGGRREHEEKRHRAQAAEVLRHHVAVDRDLQEIRLDEERDRPGGEKDEREPNRRAVRPQVAPEPPHEADVVGAADDLVGLVHAQSASSSSASASSRKRSAYVPSRRRSSSCVPLSTIRPSSSTTIRSALLSVDARCEIRRHVRSG